MIKKEFAAYFSKFIEKHNYKLDYMAQEMGTAKSTMSHYKNGERIPQDEFVEKFIEVFNFDKEEANHIRNIVNRDRTPERIKKQIEVLESNLKKAQDKLSPVELDYRIPVYSKVYAGPNGTLEYGELIEHINIPSLRNGTEVIGIKVDGDSMEKTIPEGATILVKKDVEVNDRDIGVFILNNTPYVKRFRKTESEAYLISDNNNYLPIAITKNDEFYIVGKVVEYLCKL